MVHIYMKIISVLVPVTEITLVKFPYPDMTQNLNIIWRCKYDGDSSGVLTLVIICGGVLLTTTMRRKSGLPSM